MEIEAIEPPTTRRELRKQDRRQAIVEAARTSFLEHGYAGTSMSGLLKTLGGSKATLWSYFRSKEELFAAVIEDLSAAFRAQVADALSADDDLKLALFNFCRTFIAKITSAESVPTWRLVVAESSRFPEVGKIFYEQAASHTQAQLRAFIARQIEQGKLVDENPTRMAQALTDLCVGQNTRQLWGMSPLTPDELNEHAESIARWFLKAYAPE